jgi:hypothetical protein
VSKANIKSNLVKTVNRFLIGVQVVVLIMAFSEFVSAEITYVENVYTLISQLKQQPTTSEIVRIAEEIGPIVDEVRKSKIDVGELKKLASLLKKMRELTQQRVMDLERESGQNEASLERLYRSQSYDDLSFSQAAFAYWRAWIDLELARRIGNESIKNRTLITALNGFRVASMQLFRLGLVYGGWLGIGYVEMELGNHDRAREIFDRLDDALSAAPDSPVREALSLELRLLEARTGNVKPVNVSRNIDDNEARILRIESFALLDQNRITGNQYDGVEQRLRSLIEADRMDQSLLNDMMNYAGEIAGMNIGPWTYLAAAEFRLRHNDYHKALQKFEVFFNKGINLSSVDLDHYRYRWAFAAYKAKRYQSSARILEQLVRKKNLSSDTDKAVAKLLYVVRASLEQKNDSIVNRKLLLTAAQRFVRKNPADSDADTARLAIAQLTSDTKNAIQSLNQIQSKSNLGSTINHTRFKIVARDFNLKIARGETQAAAELAIQGIRAFHALLERDKVDSLNNATLLKMRALVDPSPDKVFIALDVIDFQIIADDFKKQVVRGKTKLATAIAKKGINTFNTLPETEKSDLLNKAILQQMHMFLDPNSNELPESKDIVVKKGFSGLDIRRASVWSRLQLYDRLNDWPRIIEFMRSLATTTTPSWHMDYLYPWIASRENLVQRLELARLVHPFVLEQIDMDRRVRRLIIESLISLENNKEAYEQARIFARTYPSSGDAWRLLAHSAELINKPYEADRSWGIITDKAVPTMLIWWEGMLNRVRIRTRSTRPEQACSLLEELESRVEYLPGSHKIEYETVLAESGCNDIRSIS